MTGAEAVVVLLHGIGGHGAAMAPIADALAPHLPGVIVVAPDAPDPHSAGAPARQWFSIAGVKEANRPSRVAAARNAFDRTVGEVIARHRSADGVSRLAFVGFSQGAIMALDVAASGRWGSATIVAFSGRLASPPPLRPAPGTAVLLVHGADDQVIPATESASAAADLQVLGVPTEHLELPNLGHLIDRRGLEAAGQFLRSYLSGKSDEGQASSVLT
jgi:phospholipase/carboxylesterase